MNGNEADNDAKVKGRKKRVKKTRENNQKKRTKKDADKVVEICTEPPRADQENGRNTSEPVKSKKRNQSGKISGKKVATSVVEEASNHGDGSAVGLSNSLNLKKCSANINDASGIVKKKKETIDQQHLKRAKRLKNQDAVNSNNIAELNKVLISQPSSEPSTVKSKIKASSSSKQTEKGQVSKELKTSKKVKFSSNEPTPSKSGATKVSQPLGEVNCSSMTESSPTAKSNAPFLQKCNTPSYNLCAFCQSSEESNVCFNV